MARGDRGLGRRGQDSFVFESATAFNDIDIITDFDTGSGDMLDISDILDGLYDPMMDHGFRADRNERFGLRTAC
ncbi:MAG: type I secretion C-terminal target domain-containing protein [Alphaproteobacteria bacterium]|nr:type I secretion C-terminal target domain-containing protein [Alphaproteobacteria bacterium]